MIAGLVLAAGGGVRFGATKQLADLHGRPLLEHGLATMAAADLDRLVVVLGSRADEVLAEVDLHGAEPVVCDRWGEGQSVSLAYGLAHLDDGAEPGRLPRRSWLPSATSRTWRRRRCGG